MTRIETEQMTLMTMLRILIFPVVEPLLKISVLTYAIREEVLEGVVYLLYILMILTKDNSSITGVCETFTNHRNISKSTIEGSAYITSRSLVLILWRGRRCCDEIIRIRELDKPVHAEVSSTLESSINLIEIRLAHVESIVIPEVSRDPCSTHIPVCPHWITTTLAYRAGHTPDIGVVTKTPAFLYTIVVSSSPNACNRQFLNKREQRVMHLRKITDLSWPIVLLYVDIACVVRRPRWKD
jgi:hypothetical protein